MWRVAFLIFTLDQLSKWLVVHVMDLARVGAIDVLPPFVNFRMAWNYGINFGLFSSGEGAARWVLISLALFVVALVLFWMRKEDGRWVRVSAGLLIGGAFGNVVDRVVYGAVADFLNMSCCGIRNPFSFNLADIAIFIGAVGLIFLTNDGPKKKST